MQKEFLKLKFGMFIHYNMSTYAEESWTPGYQSPAVFNPGVQTIDTDAWADAAVSAGMKYGVLTAKHAMGFCLWDSKYTTYDVMHPDCPYKKDLVAQFIKSFKNRGLKVGLYYCWHNPGFDAELDAEGKENWLKSWFKFLPPECDPGKHTLEEQNEFQKKQIVELLQRYPDVFYLWNDALDPEVGVTAEEALAFMRGVRPDVIVSANWWDWAKKGQPYVDLAVTECRHFPEGNALPGETCWVLEDTWFWREQTHTKSAKEIVAELETANSRNANFLLNVAPDKGGNFRRESIKVLEEIGKLRKGSGNC